MQAKYIDHTLLQPTATAADIERLCAEAKTYGFASVCVSPARVAQAASCLAGSDVAVCTVIDFPQGAGSRAAKIAAAMQASFDGATELDMVISLGAVKDGDWDTVRQDIAAVKAAGGERIVKVILETALLTDAEIVRACQEAQRAGADFVKTSTGFQGGGATLDAVRLMRETVGDKMGVKASGGIRDAKTAAAMIDAGANRLGTSASVAIVTEEA